MTHAEFVQGYRSGQLAAHVDKAMAMELMKTNLVAPRYRAAHLFWAWVWFLSIPAAIACFIWAKWWIGVIVLVVGFMLPRAIKESAYGFVLEQALEDEHFFKAATEARALRISERA